MSAAEDRAGLAAQLALLRDPATIRRRAHAMLALAERDALPHFRLHPERLEAAADYVTAVIRDNYPDLAIPYHARWRHFAAGGRDRWGELARMLEDQSGEEVARIRFDLCVVSVLLDAGAGPDWAFTEDGQRIARSEGLAVASLHAFSAGLFSGDPAHPLRADADGLSRISAAALGAAFQAGPGNPLEGLEGRAALMRALGEALRARPDIFAPQARIGRLYDHLAARAEEGTLPARTVLAAVLEGFAPIWPSRLSLGGENLGDVWRHPLAAPEEPAPGLLPFHKLSQWLSYSLIEALEEAGLRVTGLDELTGLPEYRNGGLFLDLGVLELRDPALAEGPLPVEHEAIVEWRALTVALLDRVAEGVRARLGLTAAGMPLARVLEGGTWAAGRRIAREKRPGGTPPLNVRSDGTVF
ncbi:URC4/urg3 family protein [Roseomonas gilardii subsp. gilardii]|uniref:URC4/urg3 family protein n=1 Tax=Roseomonas gilardii TaxID=257708 RepID=UPI001FFADDE1|nr:URC4/urg3 family protein [Roseomonas gilardii]UPG71320.1 URC4/urg3 family protein [Roseomonas gilardii subsp. gilardii]